MKKKGKDTGGGFEHKSQVRKKVIWLEKRKAHDLLHDKCCCWEDWKRKRSRRTVSTERGNFKKGGAQVTERIKVQYRKKEAQRSGPVFKTKTACTAEEG